jgi:hypothetical protein
MSFLPTFAWQQKGFDDEQERGRKLRSENRKALLEISDLAAKEGRTVGVDEWFSIVNDQIGMDGTLYNYAPANTVLESMRNNANQRAQVVQQQQRFDQFKRETDMDQMIDKTVSDMTRQGKSEAEITAQIAQMDPKVAERYAPRIPSIRQKAELADMTEGVKLAEQFGSVAGVEEFSAKFPTLTPSVREAMFSHAKKLDEKRADEDHNELQKIVTGLSGYAYSDDATMRQFIEKRLPRRMQADPAKHVQAAMDMWRGVAEGTARVEENQTRLAEQKAVIGITDEALKTTQALTLLQQKQDEARRDAMSTDPATVVKNRIDQIRGYFGSKTPKDAKVAAGHKAAQDFLSSFETVDDSAILLAADQGLEAVDKAIEKARKTAVPVADRAKRAQRDAAIRGGVGFVGDSEKDYDYIMKLGEQNGFSALQSAGGEIKRRLEAYKGDIGKVMGSQSGGEPGEVGLWPMARAMAAEFQRTRDMLAQSGKFTADSEKFNNMENAALWRHTQVFTKAAGLDPNMQATFYAMVRGELGEQNGITRAPTALETFQRGVDEQRARVRLPGQFGDNGVPRYQPFTGGGGATPQTGQAPRPQQPVPNGYRPPADPNSPF